MPVSLKHAHTAVGTNAGTGEVRKEEWNAEHVLAMATARLLGRTTAGTGAAEEIAVGTGLSLAAGSLSVAAATYQPLDAALTALAGGSDFVQFAGPASSTKVFTLPNASTTILTAADLADDAAFQAAASGKVVTAGILNTANAPEASSGTGTWNPDFDSARVFVRTITGTSTVGSPSNQRAGQSGLLFVLQTGTAGYTVSFHTDWKWPAGNPGLDSGQNRVNVVAYYVRAAGDVVASFLGAY